MKIYQFQKFHLKRTVANFCPETIKGRPYSVDFSPVEFLSVE